MRAHPSRSATSSSCGFFAPRYGPSGAAAGLTRLCATQWPPRTLGPSPLHLQHRSHVRGEEAWLARCSEGESPAAVHSLPTDHGRQAAPRSPPSRRHPLVPCLPLGPLPPLHPLLLAQRFLLWLRAVRAVRAVPQRAPTPSRRAQTCIDTQAYRTSLASCSSLSRSWWRLARGTANCALNCARTTPRRRTARASHRL